MTASNYAQLTRTATRLLTNMGCLVTLTRRSAGTYNTATGAAAVTTTLYSGMGVVRAYPRHLVDGQNVLQTDRQVILSVSSGMVEPMPGDTVSLTGAGVGNGAANSVVTVETVAPGGTTVLYKLQIRAA
jgi:hypothetical protein